MPEVMWGHVATIACVRAGGDLLVAVNRERADDGERERIVVHAFDSDNNPVFQLGAFLDEAQAFAMLSTLVGIAREARGPGLMADFDMVGWTYIDDTTGQAEWAGGIVDVDVCNGIGT